VAAAIHEREHVPAPDEWGQVFGDEVLATAILDRLLHHCEVVAINGPSYRLKNRLKAIERETEVA
jgi:DNA replication protein DnaC